MSHSIKLSVPFIPDRQYAHFLEQNSSAISCLYFPLNHRSPLDARVKQTDKTADTESMIRTLGPLAHVKKYILMNTRFVPPALYRDTDGLNEILDQVLRLHRAVHIQGIVIADLYLANALDSTNHPVIPKLEAVPGINAMPDSIEKTVACMDMLGRTQFAPAGRIILDRSLNRYPEKLASLYHQIKSAYPQICVEILANEGCIFHCPFKPAHDAHIALSNSGLVKEETWQTNQHLGCHAYFNEHPHTFLKSPFIRPEDTRHYKGMADSIKLSGRTLGAGFLMTCIKAYTQGFFDGNLLEIMDAAGFLSGKIHLSNSGLDPDFFKTLTTCTKDCRNCRICRTIFEKAAHFKPVELPRYEDLK